MGCGQSKIGIIYPRKNKRKTCNKKSDVSAEGDEESEEADRGGTVSPTSEDDEEAKKTAAAARIRQLVSSGPLLAHTEISSSQLDFFKMLDEKIENGADYDATSEYERAAERHRMATLIRDWEAASSRSLPSTPVRKPHPQKQYYLPHPHPQPVTLANGDLFMQQQYYQQFQQQQYQIRGQFFMPHSHPQYPRGPPQFLARSFHPQPPPPAPATAVVRYGRSRGVFTELA